MPENTGEKQEESRFRKGKSGNPNGRPQGARNKASILAEQLLMNDIQDICKSVVLSAKSGNMQAAKIILDRLLPPKKDRLITIKFPKIKTPKDVLKAFAIITQAIAYGEISPAEGEALARILDSQAKAIELYEFEQMLSQLENREVTN